MNRATWKLSEGKTVDVSHGFWGQVCVDVDGKRVFEGRKLGLSKRVDFRLDEKREAQLVISTENSQPDYELWIDHDVFLPEGHSGEKEDLPSAAGGIWLMAIVFAFSGVVTFFLMRGELLSVLEEVRGLEAEAPYPKPVHGRIITVGQVKKLVNYQLWGALSINLFLSALMVGLAFLSRKAPVVAVSCAAVFWLGVQFFNAQMDPSTIGQGWVIKVIVTALLLRGFVVAFDRRKALQKRTTS